MGLTVKRENDFGNLFDKFASLPDDVKQAVDTVDKTAKKTKAADKQKENK
ncbi:SPJ_0845 family protein [Bombilactobacillus bombi]|nr:SPJ_0845 family protein [Bombilactobacillus bombi]